VNLSLRGGDPVAQSARNVQRGEGVYADAGAAVLEIQLQIGGPERVSDDFVEAYGATVGDKRGFGGELLAHPGDVLVPPVEACPCDGDEIFAGLRVVYHQRELVSSLAFVDSGAKEEVMVAVVHVKGRFHVVFGKFYGIGAIIIDGVFDVASALDFPAAVDVAACQKREGERT